MILTSHQPDFLPYLGFFYKAAHSDAMVFSDDVQFSKKGMHNWNYIKTPLGAKKLTVPVHARHDLALHEVTVADIRYSLLGIAKTIEQNYRRARHFEEGSEIVARLREYAQRPRLTLAEMNIDMDTFLMKRLGVEPKEVHVASELGIQGHKDERILQMCEILEVDTYLSGRGAAAYHDPDKYRARKIDLVYTDYRPFEYPQLYGEFIPNLSVVDFIFNCGYELPEEWRRR